MEEEDVTIEGTEEIDTTEQQEQYEELAVAAPVQEDVILRSSSILDMAEAAGNSYKAIVNRLVQEIPDNAVDEQLKNAINANLQNMNATIGSINLMQNELTDGSMMDEFEPAQIKGPVREIAEQTNTVILDGMAAVQELASIAEAKGLGLSLGGEDTNQLKEFESEVEKEISTIWSYDYLVAGLLRKETKRRFGSSLGIVEQSDEFDQIELDLVKRKRVKEDTAGLSYEELYDKTYKENPSFVQFFYNSNPRNLDDEKYRPRAEQVFQEIIGFQPLSKLYIDDFWEKGVTKVTDYMDMFLRGASKELNVDGIIPENVELEGVDRIGFFADGQFTSDMYDEIRDTVVNKVASYGKINDISVKDYEDGVVDAIAKDILLFEGTRENEMLLEAASIEAVLDRDYQPAEDSQSYELIKRGIIDSPLAKRNGNTTLRYLLSDLAGYIQARKNEGSIILADTSIPEGLEVISKIKNTTTNVTSIEDGLLAIRDMIVTEDDIDADDDEYESRIKGPWLNSLADTASTVYGNNERGERVPLYKRLFPLLYIEGADGKLLDGDIIAQFKTKKGLENNMFASYINSLGVDLEKMLESATIDDMTFAPGLALDSEQQQQNDLADEAVVNCAICRTDIGSSESETRCCNTRVHEECYFGGVNQMKLCPICNSTSDIIYKLDFNNSMGLQPAEFGNIQQREAVQLVTDDQNNPDEFAEELELAARDLESEMIRPRNTLAFPVLTTSGTPLIMQNPDVLQNVESRLSQSEHRTNIADVELSEIPMENVNIFSAGQVSNEESKGDGTTPNVEAQLIDEMQKYSEEELLTSVQRMEQSESPDLRNIANQALNRMGGANEDQMSAFNESVESHNNDYASFESLKESLDNANQEEQQMRKIEEIVPIIDELTRGIKELEAQTTTRFSQTQTMQQVVTQLRETLNQVEDSEVKKDILKSLDQLDNNPNSETLTTRTKLAALKEQLEMQNEGMEEKIKKLTSNELKIASRILSREQLDKETLRAVTAMDTFLTNNSLAEYSSAAFTGGEPLQFDKLDDLIQNYNSADDELRSSMEIIRSAQSDINNLLQTSKSLKLQYRTKQTMMVTETGEVIDEILNTPAALQAIPNQDLLALENLKTTIMSNVEALTAADLTLVANAMQRTIEKYLDEGEDLKITLARVRDEQTTLKQERSEMEELALKGTELTAKIKEIDDKLVQDKIIPSARFPSTADISAANLGTLSRELEETTIDKERELVEQQNKLSRVKEARTELVSAADKLASTQRDEEDALQAVYRRIQKTVYDNRVIPSERPQDVLEYMDTELQKINDTKEATRNEIDEIRLQHSQIQSELEELETLRREEKEELASKEKRERQKINMSIAEEAEESAIRMMDNKLQLIENLNSENENTKNEYYQQQLNLSRDEVRLITGKLRDFDEMFKKPQNPLDMQNSAGVPIDRITFVSKMFSDKPPSEQLERWFKTFSRTGALRTDSLKNIGKDVFSSGTQLMTNLYSAIAELGVIDKTVEDIDDRTTMAERLENKIDILVRALSQTEAVVLNLDILDEKFIRTQARGGEYANRSLTDLQDANTQGEIITQLNQMHAATLNFETLLRESSSFSHSDTMAYANTISQGFERIEKQLSRIESKSTVLQTRFAIDQQAKDMITKLQESLNRNRQENANGVIQVAELDLDGGDNSNTERLGQLITDMIESAAISFVGGGRVGSDMSQQLADILSNNNLIEAADENIVAENIKRFVDNTSEQFREKFVDRLAQLTSKEFADIYMQVDANQASRILSNKTGAKQFILEAMQPDPPSAEQLYELRKTLPEIGEVQEARKQVWEEINDVIENNLRPVKIDSVEEEVNKAITARTSESAGSIYIDDSEKDLNKTTLVSLAAKEREIYSTPKEMLIEKKEEISADKNKWTKLYSEYNIKPDYYVQDIKSSMQKMLQYIMTVGMANSINKNTFTNYEVARVHADDPFREFTARELLMLSADYIYNEDSIIDEILAPIQAQMNNGQMPSREDIFNIRALRNISSFLHDNFEELYPERANLELDENNRSLSEEQRQRLSDVASSTNNLGRTRNEMHTEIANYLDDYAERVAEFGREFTSKNIQFLDKISETIQEREREETLVDKQSAVNEKVERYSQSLNDHLQAMLTKQGLRSFFNQDQPSEELAQRVQEEMMPRYYPPAAAAAAGVGAQNNPFGIGGEATGGFIAFAGSEAAVTGNPNADRLSREALSTASAKIEAIRNEDIVFLENIYFDSQQNRLLYRDESAAGGNNSRDLTRDEKRRYIRLLITILMFLYITEVKKLGRVEKESAEKRLLTKYAAKNDPQPLIKMINKLAIKAIGKNGADTRTIGTPREEEQQE